MDKKSKKKVIDGLKGCKSFDSFNKIIREWSYSEKLYAQCCWLCKQYQFDRRPDKENKLTEICIDYCLDLDKIKEFAETNLKHFDIDKHLVNILKLDERLNNEKYDNERLEFITNAIDVAPIDNPSLYKGFNAEGFRFSEAYIYNFEKFNNNKSPLTHKSFGHYLKIKYNTRRNNESNKIILNQSLIESNLYSCTLSTNIKHHFESDIQIGINKLNEKHKKFLVDKLDNAGVIKVNSEVKVGDLLVAAAVPDRNHISTAEERLLSAILGERALMTRDASLYNSCFNGIITDVSLIKDKGGYDFKSTISSMFNLELGDFLGDIYGNKGQIVEIVSKNNMIERFGFNYDIVTNFKIDSYVIRLNPIVCNSLTYSRGETWNTYQYPMAESSIVMPLWINRSVVNKFNRFQLLDVLSDMIQYSKRYSNDNSIFLQIYNKGFFDIDRKDVLHVNVLKNYFLGLGVDFRVVKQGENLNLYFHRLSSEEIREISFGRVKNADFFSYFNKYEVVDGGLLCEKIFGPTKSFTCSCGKYKGKNYLKGSICDKCGVLIESKDIRSLCCGHIYLGNKYDSVFGWKLDNIIVIPPNSRPCWYNGNRVTLDEINDFYKKIIFTRDRVNKYIKIGSSAAIVSNEILILQDRIKDFEFSLLKRILFEIKDCVKNNRLAYSCKTVCVQDDSLDDDKCLIPLNALIAMFYPNIVHNLKTHFNYSLSDICKKIENVDNEVLDSLHSVIESKKVVLFSTGDDGDILYLNVGIAHGNTISLSSTNYLKICPDNNFVCAVNPISNFSCKNIKKNMSLSLLNSEDNYDNDFINKILLEDDESKCAGILIDAIKNNKEIKINSRIGKFIIKTLYSSDNNYLFGANFRNNEDLVDVDECILSDNDFEAAKTRNIRNELKDIEFDDSIFDDFLDDDLDIGDIDDIDEDDEDDDEDELEKMLNINDLQNDEE